MQIWVRFSWKCSSTWRKSLIQDKTGNIWIMNVSWNTRIMWLKNFSPLFNSSAHCIMITILWKIHIKDEKTIQKQENQYFSETFARHHHFYAIRDHPSTMWYLLTRAHSILMYSNNFQIEFLWVEKQYFWWWICSVLTFLYICVINYDQDHSSNILEPGRISRFCNQTHISNS